MMPINLYDTIRVTRTVGRSPRLACRIVDPSRPQLDEARGGRAVVELPAPEANLVYRAMRLVSHRHADGGAMRAELVKRIPSSAGLGGASSDAAALLVAARALASRPWSESTARDWAAELGSDVPFFLNPQAAWCRGRGEIVEPLRGLPPLDLVLVKPPAGLATAEVYRHTVVPANPRDGEGLVAALRAGRLRAAGRLLFNRLTESARKLTPWIDRIRHLFDGSDVLGHQMTGSGTSYFGLCYNARHARRVARQLRGRGIGSVYVVRTISAPGG